MIIERVKIKNFRSFGESGIDLKLKPGMNIIVGENNVEKSNILKAIRLLVDLIGGKLKNLDKEEWHNGETDRKIFVSASFKFNEKEHQPCIQLVIPDHTAVDDKFTNYKYRAARLQESFDNNIEVILTYEEGDKLINSVILNGLLYLPFSYPPYRVPHAA